MNISVYIVMRQKLFIAATILIASTLPLAVVPLQVDAQQINNPTHIPNAQRRKIMNIQLLGRVTQAEVESDVEDVIGEFLPDLDSLSDIADCAVNIGTTDSDGVSFGNVERDVVIAGDVITLCN